MHNFWKSVENALKYETKKLKNNLTLKSVIISLMSVLHYTVHAWVGIIYCHYSVLPSCSNLVESESIQLLLCGWVFAR